MKTITTLTYRARVVPGFAVFATLSHGGRVYGSITKRRNDRFTTTPWQAFQGDGDQTRLIGSFYGTTGKQRAVEAVTKSYRPSSSE
jgi:hypothetical protein